MFHAKLVNLQHQISFSLNPNEHFIRKSVKQFMIKGTLYLLVSLGLLTLAYVRMQHTPKIKYLPLGDSYTIGTGASEQDAWPVLLAKHLNERGITCEILTNPARNGFSTYELISEELPLVAELKPDFITLLIGVNDWVRGVSKEKYALHLAYILDTLQKNLKNKTSILLVNIADFGVTPYGKNFSGGRNIRQGISEFNMVIEQEAKKRGLKVVDLFSQSVEMERDVSLVSSDGLHPSAKGYARWEALILPAVLEVLK